jgi:predicted aspartyl protease
MSQPFQARRGLVIVGAELYGPSGSVVLRLAVDTGATSTLIGAGLLVAVGYDPAMASSHVQVTTGSGVLFAPRVQIQRLDALGTSQAQFEVLAHTLPPSAGIDGLLGLDFMRGRILNVDFRAGQIDLA